MILIHDTHHTKVNCENVFNDYSSYWRAIDKNEYVLWNQNYRSLHDAVHILTTGLGTLESFKNRSLISKRIDYILQWNLLEKSL